MNIAATAKADHIPGVELIDGSASLKALKTPSCAAAVWQRDMPQSVKTWLADLDAERLPRGRIILRPEMAATAFHHLCDMAAMPKGPERDWLQADIAQLAAEFSQAMEAEYLRLRLDVITTNACRKFHIDAVTARLVCTYRGSGTQYGTPKDGQDPRVIFQVDTGEPILLRGTLWPETPASGLRHRSPPIEGTGEVRLVLVLDPVSDPEEEA